MSLNPENDLSYNKFTSTDFIKDFSNSIDQVQNVYLGNDTRVETGIRFEDPYDSLWLKMITAGVYMVEVFSSAVMIAFISFERDFGHYRTLINQLLSYLYGVGAFYGTFVCGIRNLRVWYGPLPEMLCMVHVKMTQMMYTVLFCLIAYVTIAKFTFICIWKSMRVMNDDLLVRIIISQISFICILFWWPFDGHLGSEIICAGISDGKGIYGQNEYPNFITVVNDFHSMLMLLCISASCILMVAIKIVGSRECYNLYHQERLKIPKNLDSILLNLVLLMLIIASSVLFRFWKNVPVNQLGDYPIYIAMYLAQIVLPMIGVLAIAIKILVKNGADMRRELLGVNVKLITNKDDYKVSESRKKNILGLMAGTSVYAVAWKRAGRAAIASTTAQQSHHSGYHASTSET